MVAVHYVQRVGLLGAKWPSFAPFERASVQIVCSQPLLHTVWGPCQSRGDIETGCVGGCAAPAREHASLRATKGGTFLYGTVNGRAMVGPLDW